MLIDSLLLLSSLYTIGVIIAALGIRRRRSYVGVAEVDAFQIHTGVFSLWFVVCLHGPEEVLSKMQSLMSVLI